MKLEDISKCQILKLPHFFYNNRIPKRLGNVFEENVSTCIYNIRRDHLFPFPIIAGIISLEMTSLRGNLFPNSKKKERFML